jgi:hypothetical protein
MACLSCLHAGAALFGALEFIAGIPIAARCRRDLPPFGFREMPAAGSACQEKEGRLLNRVST